MGYSRQPNSDPHLGSRFSFPTSRKTRNRMRMRKKWYLTEIVVLGPVWIRPSEFVRTEVQALAQDVIEVCVRTGNHRTPRIYI
jgi:hypothetical protein